MNAKKLIAESKNVYSIHYSCESLDDQNTGITPRIAAICLFHFETKNIKIYSIYTEADCAGINVKTDKIDYDLYEKKMLEKFFEFMKNNSTCTFVHWNMRSIIYGFQALEYRYQKYTGKDESLNLLDSQLINLNDLLKETYSQEYVQHPRMKNLMQQNWGLHKDFLTGEEEVKAFQDKEFVKLSFSTACKVKWMYNVVERMKSRKLIVDDFGFWQRFFSIFDSDGYKILGFLGIVASVLSFLFCIFGS
jgi:hypothetical protein